MLQVNQCNFWVYSDEKISIIFVQQVVTPKFIEQQV